MKKVFNDIVGTSQIHLDVMKAILEEPGGMIICDLMACEGSQTSLLNVGGKVYVDVVERSIKNFEKEKDTFVKMDAIEYLKTTDKYFSACICSDGIEHVEKERGIELLKWMEKRSVKQIIFTPLGDYLIETTKTNNPDSHKSGWTSEEFEELGYATLVFPNFHPTLKTGGLFAFKSKGLKEDFERVCAWCEHLETGLLKPTPIEAKLKR